MHRFPIRCGLLELILFKVRHRFAADQAYLCILYMTLKAIGYYGLMQLGELTKSNHVMKACNVYLGENKDKLLIVLFSSKTHHEGSRPQQIKITANAAEKSGMYRKKNFCPLTLISAYLQVRGKYLNYDEQFFIFRDGMPVSAKGARDMLRKIIRDMGLDDQKYSMHSLRIG